MVALYLSASGTTEWSWSYLGMSPVFQNTDMHMHVMIMNDEKNKVELEGKKQVAVRLFEIQFACFVYGPLVSLPDKCRNGREQK